jgi:hypothetical protein
LGIRRNDQIDPQKFEREEQEETEEGCLGTPSSFRFEFCEMGLIRRSLVRENGDLVVVKAD